MGLVLRLSDKCNNKCYFCERYHANSRLITAEEIERLNSEKETITIACESTISDSFFKTLEILRNKNKDIIIETNGRIFIYQDIIDKLKDFPIKHIDFLVLSSKKNSYERITKIKDSFQQSLNGIKRIIRNKISINAKIIINDENMNEVDDMIDLARRISPKLITANFILSDEFIKERYKLVKKVYDNHKDITILGADDELRILGIVYNRSIIGPYYLDIDIINSCNLNCNYCWDHSPLLKHSRKEKEWINKMISLDLLKKIVLEGKKMRSMQIGFGGSGEPLLHPEIKNIIEFIKKQDMNVTICTNATLIDKEMAIFLAKNNVLLRVNISAGSIDIYEKTHPNNGNKFEIVKRNLIEYSKQLKKYNPSSKWEIINILTKDNYQELEQMVQLGIDTACDEIHFMLMNTVEETKSLLIPSNKIKDFENIIDSCIEFEKNHKIWTNLKILKDIVQNKKDSTAKELYNYTENLSEEVGCYCSWYYNRIDSENCLNLCGELPIESSNIEKDRIMDTLNSDLVKKIRHKIQDKNPETMLEICKSCFEYETNLMIHGKLQEAGAKLEKDE